MLYLLRFLYLWQQEKEGASIHELSQCKTKTCLLSKGAIPADRKNEDGLLIEECYQVQKPKGTASRAVMHGLLDVVTLGIWEVAGTPIEGSVGKKERNVFHKSLLWKRGKYKSGRISSVKIKCCVPLNSLDAVRDHIEGGDDLIGDETAQIPDYLLPLFVQFPGTPSSLGVQLLHLRTGCHHAYPPVYKFRYRKDWYPVSSLDRMS